MIGPPSVVLYCWFFKRHDRFEDGSGALHANRGSSREHPVSCCVPDLVMAFTCTPDERPCVASNRFEMNWKLRDRVAAEARLDRRAELAGDLLAVEIELELANVAPGGSDPARAPPHRGRAIARREQRQRHPVAPCTGSSDICFAIDVAAEARIPPCRAAALRAVTVTVPCSVEGAICRFEHRVLTDEHLDASACHCRETLQARSDDVLADADREAEAAAAVGDHNETVAQCLMTAVIVTPGSTLLVESSPCRSVWPPARRR
jgi:hypothetical protein